MNSESALLVVFTATISVLLVILYCVMKCSKRPTFADLVFAESSEYENHHQDYIWTTTTPSPHHEQLPSYWTASSSSLPTVTLDYIYEGKPPPYLLIRSQDNPPPYEEVTANCNNNLNATASSPKSNNA